MGRFIEVSEVRAASGVSVDLISDPDMEELIVDTEYRVEDKLNTSFTPRTVLELYNGDSSERLVLQNNPMLKLRALKIDTTDVTPEYCRLKPNAGIIYLTTDAELSYFREKAEEGLLIKVKYDFGYLTPSTTQTSTTEAVIAGDSIAISVSSESNFAENDYIEITGMDSMYEVAKVTSTASGTITVDNLSVPHESDSLITKLEVPPVVKRMMRIGTGLAAVARVVGESFDEITSYRIGDMEVRKGEPYTQWRQTAIELLREWKEITKSFRTRPAIG